MTTTPEQLQAWREEGEKAWGTKASKYSTAYQFFIEGYLHAKQETDQAMKLAKFGAMVMRDPSNGSIDKRELLQYAILADVISPEVEATIKELLND